MHPAHQKSSHSSWVLQHVAPKQNSRAKVTCHNGYLETQQQTQNECQGGYLPSTTENHPKANANVRGLPGPMLAVDLRCKAARKAHAWQFCMAWQTRARMFPESGSGNSGGRSAGTEASVSRVLRSCPLHSAGLSGCESLRPSCDLYFIRTVWVRGRLSSCPGRAAPPWPRRSAPGGVRMPGRTDDRQTDATQVKAPLRGAALERCTSPDIVRKRTGRSLAASKFVTPDKTAARTGVRCPQSGNVFPQTFPLRLLQTRGTCDNGLAGCYHLQQDEMPMSKRTMASWWVDSAKVAGNSSKALRREEDLC